MSLDNLDAPLRVTWDLCPPGRTTLNDLDLLKVAGRLVDAGLFYLLLDEQPLLHPGLPAIHEYLSANGCQVSIVLKDDPAELLRLERLKQPYTLFIDAGCWLGKPEGLQQLENVFQKLTSAGLNPSLLWVPVTGQLLQLYPLLDLCKRQKIPRFKLPNHKITVNSGSVETAELLQANDLDVLRNYLSRQPLPQVETALEVHDLFLWELIFPQGGGERSEYGGCQAGNSLGHIAVTADVWPCSSWPKVMGNLLEEDLYSIWETVQRQRVRDEVACEPADCAGCRDYAICFGGCRGLSRTCYQESVRRDILCSGPRK